MGQDSSALRPELSFRHFGTGVEVPAARIVRTHKTGAEVSRVRSVRLPVIS